MQNERMTLVRPKQLKLKNDWRTIILQVLLYFSMFFSLFYFGKHNFNSLFIAIIDPSYTDLFGISMSSYIASMGNKMLIAMKIMLPAICALIIFLFYFLFAKFFGSLTCNQMLVFKLDFSYRRFRICLDGSITLLCLLLGIFQVIFNYYPLATNFGSVLIPPVLALISMAVFYFSFTSNIEKKYRLFVLNIMMLPTIVLVLFA